MEEMSECVYLIHAERKLSGRACHYAGTAQGDPSIRLERHRSGSGAKILRAMVEAGIAFDIVRTWPGGRELERRLKRQKNHRRLCPRCNPHAFQREKIGPTQEKTS